MMLTYIYN